MHDTRASNARPDNNPINNDNGSMNYPISVLWAEVQRLQHRIQEVKNEQTQAERNPPPGLEYLGQRSDETVVDKNAQTYHKDVCDRVTLISALQAKVARLGQAIYKLEREE